MPRHTRKHCSSSSDSSSSSSSDSRRCRRSRVPRAGLVFCPTPANNEPRGIGRLLLSTPYSLEPTDATVVVRFDYGWAFPPLQSIACPVDQPAPNPPAAFPPPVPQCSLRNASGSAQQVQVILEATITAVTSGPIIGPLGFVQIVANGTQVLAEAELFPGTQKYTLAGAAVVPAGANIDVRIVNRLGNVGVHAGTNLRVRLPAFAPPAPLPLPVQTPRAPVPQADVIPACVRGKLALYGVITAFAPEITELQNQFNPDLGFVDVRGRRFFRGVLDGRLIVAVVSGIGMVNAALTTQLMIDKFNPDFLFFSGIAGGVNPRFRIGDVVISQQLGQYQYQKFIRTESTATGVPCSTFTDVGNLNFPDVFYRAVNPATALPHIPSTLRPSCLGCSGGEGCAPLPEAQNGVVFQVEVPNPFPPPPTILVDAIRTDGMSIPMFSEVLRRGADAFPPIGGIVPQQFWYPVSPRMLAAADLAIEQGIVLPNQICPTPETCYTPQVFIGDNGVAQSTFVDNREYRIDVEQVFGADVLDMESPAFAVVCTSNLDAQGRPKPFLVIRSLSDLAGGDEGLNPILQFLGVAAQHSIIVLRAVLQFLPINRID